MGAIADRVRQMISEGAKGRDIVAEIERMEAGGTADLFGMGEVEKLAAGFVEWWAHWPDKVAKKEAEVAYRAARRKGHTAEALLHHATHYIATKPVDRPWMHASTFLRGERWKDQAAPVQSETRGLAAARNTLRQRIVQNGYGSPSSSGAQHVGRLPSR